MKILFVIPHFYKPQGNAHGSLAKDPTRRIKALSVSILSLHQHFGSQQCEINLHHKALVEANNPHRHQVDVMICTTGGAHLLEKLPVPKTLYFHCETKAKPPLLGYECHRLLRDAIGKYDFYCFLEDDLAIHDASFFQKLTAFNNQATKLDLLLPNRFEIGKAGPYLKTYIDGDMHPRATKRFQDVNEQPKLQMEWLGQKYLFSRTLNPHSGCFFLTQAQMRYWNAQPYFLERRTDFIGPLESAATLGIMRTFRIYKPARENANFLEIRHADNRFIQMIGGGIRNEFVKPELQSSNL